MGCCAHGTLAAWDLLLQPDSCTCEAHQEIQDMTISLACQRLPHKEVDKSHKQRQASVNTPAPAGPACPSPQEGSRPHLWCGLGHGPHQCLLQRQCRGSKSCTSGGVGRWRGGEGEGRGWEGGAGEAVGCLGQHTMWHLVALPQTGCMGYPDTEYCTAGSCTLLCQLSAM